jgi:hypothetical protein
MSKTEKSPIIIIRDVLRREVEKRTEGAVTVMYDDHDLPSYMLRIPRFNLETVDSGIGKGTHPAFIVGEREVAELFIGLVPATRIGGVACSLPGNDRTCNITFDEAREMCSKKGRGWHLLTSWEWAALVAFLVKTRFADFVKSWWEWTDGLKLVDGKFYFPKNNDFEKPEAEWEYQGAGFDDVDGRPVLTAEVTSRSGADGGYTHIDQIAELEKTESYNALPADVRLRLAQLLIDPVVTPVLSAISGDNDLYVRNYSERVPLRGGYWSSGADAGLAALYLGGARSYSHGNIGLRPAFINLKD